LVESSDYDIETAKAMLKTGRYLYVGFMCHQVVEKAFKAIMHVIVQKMKSLPRFTTY
jgi:HEPN domain-containing protein